MPLTVTTVNGGHGRVVFGANGRPAHIIELGPVYIRLDVSDGLDFLDLPAGGMAVGSFIMQQSALYARAYRIREQGRAAAYAANFVHTGGLALGVPNDLPAGGTAFTGGFTMQQSGLYARAFRVEQSRRAAAYASNFVHTGGLALGVPS